MATFEIGDKIKSLRKIMGLSQDELTKKVGYKSRQFIADIENNKTKPSFDFVMTFALIFKKLTKLPFSFVNLANPAKDYKAVFESKFTEKSSINYDLINTEIADKFQNNETIARSEFVIEDLLGSDTFAYLINHIVDHLNYGFYKKYLKQQIEDNPDKPNIRLQNELNSTENKLKDIKQNFPLLVAQLQNDVLLDIV